jgi:hypothetical protein
MSDRRMADPLLDQVQQALDCPWPLAAEALRVAIHDALLEAGHDELAALARACAVAMAGFPDRPARPGELMIDFLGRIVVEEVARA